LCFRYGTGVWPVDHDQKDNRCLIQPGPSQAELAKDGIVASRDFSRGIGDGYLEGMVDKRVEEPAKAGRPTAGALETFENPHPQRDYVIETICPEFTSLCPKTGQPDFGTVTISYVPDRLCFELKSLKLYLQQYRNHGAFYEDVTNRILDDLVAATQPRSMKITAAFTPRGGIRTNVHVEYP
jgi:7-cyano-7-deazaguanine reductase